MIKRSFAGLLKAGTIGLCIAALAGAELATQRLTRMLFHHSA